MEHYNIRFDFRGIRGLAFRHDDQQQIHWVDVTGSRLRGGMGWGDYLPNTSRFDVLRATHTRTPRTGALGQALGSDFRVTSVAV